MIAVINYEMGNVGSVLNMMRKLRIQAKLTRDPKDLDQACGIILPGVGSYDRGMKQLCKCDLVTLLAVSVGQLDRTVDLVEEGFAILHKE